MKSNFRERLANTFVNNPYPIMTMIQTICGIEFVMWSVILFVRHQLEYPYSLMVLCVVEMFAVAFCLCSIGSTFFVRKAIIQDIKDKYKLEYYKELK